MVKSIKFGTDGWRGYIAEDFTFESLRRCTQGFALYLLEKGLKGKWIVVGYDNRFHSENFARSASEVLAGNGFRVYLTNAATPTPVISYSVVNKKAAAAVNITASHNPPTDNGYKVRDHNGGAIDPEGLKRIESLIPGDESHVKKTSFSEAVSLGSIEVFDPAPAYFQHINRILDLTPIKEAPLHVLVDTMWGNGAGWFSKILEGGKINVEEIHATRNPIFPEMTRPEPIPPNINVGLAETTSRKADVLLITDGDADRLGVGDEQGRFINQLRVFALLAYYLLEIRGERGAIVKTISTTSMLNKLGKIYNVPVYETGVGFKYVAPKFLETNALIGGEESGGYAFRGNVPERDGILAGLYILDMMVRLKKKPSELLEILFSKIGAHYYDRIDKPFKGDRASKEKMILNANPATIGGLACTGLDTLDGFKFNLEDGGWLLIRFSGTEPILRIYCETTKEENVALILQDGLKIVGEK